MIYSLTIDEAEELRASIWVTRYRRDRLKIVVSDFDGSGYAGRLRKWLIERWGDDGVKERYVSSSLKQLLEKV
jgi:hypothetical protein